MMKVHSVMGGISLCVVVVGFAAGCSDDGDAQPPPCVWIVDPDECTDDEIGSNDEVGDGDGDPNGGTEGDGDGDGDEPEEDPLAFCQGERLRTVHQCGGMLAVTISFNTKFGNCGKVLGDPGWCDEFHQFGIDFDPYEMPAVMACCDAEITPQDTLLRFCAADMVEQICLSAPKRLQMLIDDGVITLGKKQAKALRKWLDAHQQECYDSLYHPGDTPGTIAPVSWKVNGGKNKKWSILENFTIRIDEAVTTTASLPPNKEDYLTCYDGTFNNTEVFEEVEPVSPGINDILYLATGGDASINGPVFAEGRVHGIANIASKARQCEDPWCSSLEVTEAAGLWTLEDLNIFADAPVTITYGDLEFELDRAALRLYGTSHGTYDDRSPFHVIDSGDAQFLISGVSGQISGIRWARNITPITAHESGSGWTLDSFTVAHVDGKGEVWKITVPTTTWD